MSDSAQMTEEVVNISFREERINLQITEERFTFTSPVSLTIQQNFSTGGSADLVATPGSVDGIPAGIPTTIDSVNAEGNVLAIKWLLFVVDRVNGLALSSEINLLWRNGMVWFTEFAILGDSSISYALDVADTGTAINLSFTSQYEALLDIRVVRVGIIN